MHFQPASHTVIAENTCRLQKSGVLLKKMIAIPCNFEAGGQDVFRPPVHQVEQRSPAEVAPAARTEDNIQITNT